MCALGLFLKAERINPHPENLQVAKLSTTTSRTTQGSRFFIPLRLRSTSRFPENTFTKPKTRNRRTRNGCYL